MQYLLKSVKWRCGGSLSAHQTSGADVMGSNQGWDLLIRSLLIRSLLIRSFAHLLICSNRSDQMSDCERFAQIAQDKRATVSESLRLLMSKERL